MPALVAMVNGHAPPRARNQSPNTVFGPLLVVLYIGQTYLAFRDSVRIYAFTTHFDQLVREASFNTQGMQEYVNALK